MIYTRFGTPVTIVKFNPKTVEVLGDVGHCSCWYHVSELKADGGIQEILDSADKVEQTGG